MAENGIQIRVGADVTEATKGLQKVSGELTKTAAVEKTFTQSVGKATNALREVKPGANQAGNALMNLGRIAQDAPFGFVGISNNISPLLESFQRLKTETGTTGGALKALGASLLGGGGLGLAVSVATGLLTVFGDKLFSSKKKTDELAEAQKKYADAQNSSAEGLQKQLINVESLVAVATSDVSTKKQQADALEVLNKLIPDNIGHLTAANIRTNEGVEIVKNYTKALEDQATAELLSGRAAELRVKLLNEERSEREDLNKLFKERAKMEGLATVPRGVIGGNQFGTSSLSAAESIDQKLREIDDRIAQRMQDFVTNKKTYTKELDDLRKEITKNTAGSVALEIQDPKKVTTKKEEDSLAKRLQQLEALKTATGLLKKEEFELLDVRIQLASRDAVKNGLDPAQLQRVIDTLVNKADLEVGVSAKLEMPQAPVINTEMALLGRNLAPLTVPVNIDTKAASDKLKTFQDTMQSALTSAASSIAQGLGDVLGEALSGGNPLAAGITLIADTLVQLGKAAVGAGIAMLSLKQLFKNPGTAIAAGIAAIALGAAIKSSIPKFADGGIVTGPTMGLIGEAGPEVIFPLNKLNQFIGGRNAGVGGESTVVEHRIQGQELVLLINRAQNRVGSTSRI